MAKRFPAHKIKSHRIYTPWEAAECLGCHRATVRRWIRSGNLKADASQRPVLIRGADLRDFLGQRQAKNQMQMEVHHFLCFRCKAPQDADGKVADYTQISATSGQLTALCPCCGGVMHKIIRRADLPTIEAKLEVTIQQASPRLVSCTKPRSEVDFKEGAEIHAEGA